MFESKTLLSKFKNEKSEKGIDSKLYMKESESEIKELNLSKNSIKIIRRKRLINIFNPLKNIYQYKKEKNFAKNFISLFLYFIICCIILFFITNKILVKLEIGNIDSLNSLEFIELINPKNFRKLHLISFNKYKFKYLKDKYYNITNFKYLFSFFFNIVKVEYNIGIFDEYQNLISPSDLPLYDDLHFLCHFEVVNHNISIDSLANIYQNKFFNCIEFCKINEKVKFGIKILKGRTNEFLELYHFTEELFDFRKNTSLNSEIFSPNHIKENHKDLLKILKKEKLKQNLRLKSIYIKYPLCDLKRNSVLKEGIWTFKNIYNHYFCFCKGNKCLLQNLTQLCKFNIYKYIIDKNRYEYEKTDYLFIDFIFKEFGEDDTYPVFKEMAKENSSHYLTENTEIYKKFCFNEAKCLKIIPMNRTLFNLYGDFVEKYLTLFLKLKAVISAKPSPFHIMCNLFYNIEYITYISIGHGLCYFKDFLYYEYQIYGVKMNNKLLIPPSKILINLAKRYGWKEKDLIKINFPRWDKYNFKITLKSKWKIKRNSILIMFTWRSIKHGEKISPYYFTNITDLITNELLLKELKKKNITLYFTMHRFLYFRYLNQYKKVNNGSDFVFINQKEISECLRKIDLIITDFSSVVFDVMYRKKPFIIYFPDIDEPNIDIIYSPKYSYVIKAMKKNKFGFKNVYFNINDTVKKIIYYVKNNFIVEKELKTFYDSFIPKREESIPKFIDYLKKLT